MASCTSLRFLVDIFFFNDRSLVREAYGVVEFWSLTEVFFSRAVSYFLALVFADVTHQLKELVLFFKLVLSPTISLILLIEVIHLIDCSSDI